MAQQFVYLWRDALEAAPELVASDRHVALVVMEHMDAGGKNAWPNIDRIVSKTALSKSTVLSSREWLRESGWIVPVRRSRRQSTLYAAAIPETRKSRHDRTVWAMKRRERLSAQRCASRSEPEPTESVGTVTHLEGALSRSESESRVGRNRDASRSESLQRVGRNGEPRTTPEYPVNNPVNTPLASYGTVSSYAESAHEQNPRLTIAKCRSEIHDLLELADHPQFVHAARMFGLPVISSLEAHLRELHDRPPVDVERLAA